MRLEALILKEIANIMSSFLFSPPSTKQMNKYWLYPKIEMPRSERLIMTKWMLRTLSLHLEKNKSQQGQSPLRLPWIGWSSLPIPASHSPILLLFPYCYRIAVVLPQPNSLPYLRALAHGPLAWLPLVHSSGPTMTGGSRHLFLYH